jgi:uncharacterized protein YjbI with pentapeptide repeats
MDDRATSDNGKRGDLPTPRTGKDGKAIHDQDFFLKLARCGKDIWNKWTKTHSNIYVTFEGVNFETENKDITFEEFELGGSANFSKCGFGHNANFFRTIFGPSATFVGATFVTGPNFKAATFDRDADFSFATIGSEARFSGATFGYHTNFSFTEFAHGVAFLDATFDEDANFEGMTIESSVWFSGATFGNGANFCGVNFGDRPDLSRVIFYGTANFRPLSKDRITEKLASAPWSEEKKQQYLNRVPDGFRRITFARSRFEDAVDFSGCTFSDRCDLTGVQFSQPPKFDGCKETQRIDLYGATIRFFGKRRSLGLEMPYHHKTASTHSGQHVSNTEETRNDRGRFSAVRFWLFGYKRITDGEKYSEAISEILGIGSSATIGFFRRPVYGWTTDSDAAIRLRALRKLADETKNHDLERDLYIEERKAERGIGLAQYWPKVLRPKVVAHCLWILVMAAYWLLSDYGRNFMRPIVALAVSVFLFQWAYTAILETHNAATTNDFKNATRAYAIANALPFVGALTLDKEVKTILLCGGRPTSYTTIQNISPCEPSSVPSFGFQFITIAQSIFSAICIFFVGLALRNYFKMR